MARRLRRRIEYVREFKQLVFDVTKEVPDLTEYFKDDWYADAQCICPPVVILILCREVEIETEAKEVTNVG